MAIEKALYQAPEGIEEGGDPFHPIAAGNNEENKRREQNYEE